MLHTVNCDILSSRIQHQVAIVTEGIMRASVPVAS